MMITEFPRLAVDRALERIRSRTGMGLAFAGRATEAGGLSLDQFAGPTKGVLKGVVLGFDEGLGGRAAARRRAIAVNDYCRSEQISHHHDVLIRAEGVRSLIAAPVIVDRDAVAVLYAAFRNDDIVGDRVADVVVDEARALEQELVTVSAVRHRDVPQYEGPDPLLGRVRTAHSELRTLSAVVGDEQVRVALTRIADELAGGTTAAAIALTRREQDVLALLAAGFSNPEIASRLGLTVLTVKGYVKSVMAKLTATTRLQAVAHARNAGIIP